MCAEKINPALSSPLRKNISYNYKLNAVKYHLITFAPSHHLSNWFNFSQKAVEQIALSCKENKNKKPLPKQNVKKIHFNEIMYHLKKIKTEMTSREKYKMAALNESKCSGVSKTDEWWTWKSLQQKCYKLVFAEWTLGG